MTPEFLDTQSSRAGMRYSTFLLSLAGILAQAQQMDPANSSSLDAIRNGAAPVAQEFLSTEMELLRTDLYSVQMSASRAARADMGQVNETDAEWDPMGDSHAEWAINELGAQAWRDINSLTVARRNQMLSARFGQTVSAPVSPVFAFKDRLGRQYPAQTYVTQLYRHALVGFGVETYVNQVGQAGYDQAMVTHPEADHPHNGMIVSVPLEPATQDQIFHPNSRAFLTLPQDPEEDVPA